MIGCASHGTVKIENSIENPSSQKELAEVTGIDQSDLSKIERGVANPSVGTLKRIADALDAQLLISIA